MVQRYIMNPLLVNGFKFDLRIYVLVTQVEPLCVYVYDEGLARFATEPWRAPRVSNMRDKTVHLTNYSVNRKSAKFKVAKTTAPETDAQSDRPEVELEGPSADSPEHSAEDSSSESENSVQETPEQEEQCSKMTLNGLLKYLEAHPECFDAGYANQTDAPIARTRSAYTTDRRAASASRNLRSAQGRRNSRSVGRDLRMKLDELVALTLLAAYPRLLAKEKEAGANVFPRKQFGFYGFDVMVLATGELQLIEVNVCPATGTASQLDRDVKGNLMRDMFNLLQFEVDEAPDGRVVVPAMDSKTYARARYSREGEPLTEFERKCVEKAVSESRHLGRFRRVLPDPGGKYDALLTNRKRLNAAAARALLEWGL